MRIAVPKETAAGERRVALYSESCKKLRDAGYEISIEAGAGVQASFPDDAYRDLGVAIESDPAILLGSADLVLKIAAPATSRNGGRDEAAWMRPGAIYVGSLMPLRHLEAVRALAARGLRLFRPTRFRGPPEPNRWIRSRRWPTSAGTRRPARRRRNQPVLPDADDRRRHGVSGEGVRHRRWCRWPPGHRHGAPPGRQRRGNGRASRSEGTDRKRRCQATSGSS